MNSQLYFILGGLILYIIICLKIAIYSYMNTINILQLNLINKTKGLKLHQGWWKNFEPKKSSEGNVLPFQIFAGGFPVT